MATHGCCTGLSSRLAPHDAVPHSKPAGINQDTNRRVSCSYWSMPINEESSSWLGCLFIAPTRHRTPFWYCSWPSCSMGPTTFYGSVSLVRKVWCSGCRLCDIHLLSVRLLWVFSPELAACPRGIVVSFLLHRAFFISSARFCSSSLAANRLVQSMGISLAASLLHWDSFTFILTQSSSVRPPYWELIRPVINGALVLRLLLFLIDRCD